MRLVYLTMLAGSTLLAIQNPAPPQQAHTPLDLAQELQKIAPLAPEPCFPEEGQQADPPAIYGLFPHAAESVLAELNAPSSGASRPLDRATGALQRIEQLSAAINGAWPEEERFHFEILDLAPAIVVDMSLASGATYYVFAVPDQDAGKPGAEWRQFEPLRNPGINAMHTGLALHPLQRGPAGRPRFLANFTVFGCAGSYGGQYDAEEWNPDGFGSLVQIIQQDAAWGLVIDDPLAGIGTLKTDGPTVTLPYCWFSAIDWWDNPTLCAVDSYDLSGDSVRFIGRVSNQPDLLAVAKAIEYARAHDVPALAGYCVSDDVANDLARDMPARVFGVGLQVTAEGDGRERVELESFAVYRFEVERVGKRWLVASFRVGEE
jgi:hypothetical protein